MCWRKWLGVILIVSFLLSFILRSQPMHPNSSLLTTTTKDMELGSWNSTVQSLLRTHVHLLARTQMGITLSLHLTYMCLFESQSNTIPNFTVILEFFFHQILVLCYIFVFLVTYYCIRLMFIIISSIGLCLFLGIQLLHWLIFDSLFYLFQSVWTQLYSDFFYNFCSNHFFKFNFWLFIKIERVY